MPYTNINLVDLPDHLASLSSIDWQPLFDLIPEIEKTAEFGELEGGEEIEANVFTFPYYSNAPVVSRFQSLCYELGLVINFDWPNWEEGRELGDADQSVIDGLDLVTLCKLITVIIRNNRFNDGILIVMFENGLILRILKRMKTLVSF